MELPRLTLRTLTLRIYLTVVAVLLLFALASGWAMQRHLQQEHARAESLLSERMAAWGDLIQRSLPTVDADAVDQAAALREWSTRLRLPLALDDARGMRIVASDLYSTRLADGQDQGFAVRLEDGRTLWVMRPWPRREGTRGPMDGGPGGPPPLVGPGFFELPFVAAAWQRGVGLLVILTVLFIAVAAGAWPVVHRLTRRLQALKRGVDKFGAGELHHRVQVSGGDEVAAVAASFNAAAARIEVLVRSHQTLLANASHELRSPLARMKMAVSMIEHAPESRRAPLKREIDTNIAELDALVEEVLLASRLDASQDGGAKDKVDLLGVAAEESARVDAQLDGQPLTVIGDERLLRRALRNLLENAKRYGGSEVLVELRRARRNVELRVSDRGPGIPEPLRQRIFEPFYRLPGHAETSGGVGLGLSLVKQIAERHGGKVACAARDGGGTCFTITLPQGA